MDISDNYFEELRIVRNDAVHRGGQVGVKVGTRSRASVLIETEIILRESLKWAIVNQSEVAAAFAKDQWPEAI